MSSKLLSSYYLLGIIGEGTYGVVYQAKRVNDANQDQVFAIKRIKPTSNELERPSITSISTLREISLLRELHHENIVHLTDIVVDPKGRDVAIVMEFAQLTLEGVLREHRSSQTRLGMLPDFMCKSILYQCLRGLEFMHENWVLHRDLKPQNILIVQDGEKRGLLQLADMGLARVFQSPIKALGKVDKTVVTLWYRAPELLLGACHYTTAVDIWSMGCIFGELFFGEGSNSSQLHALFPGKQEKGSFEEDQCRCIFQILGMPNPADWRDVTALPLYKKMEEKLKDKCQKPSQLTTFMSSCSNTLISKAALGLLGDMLELNPSRRISATAALNHQYFEMFKKQFKPKQILNCLDDPSQSARRYHRYQVPDLKPLSAGIRQAQGDVHKNLISNPPQPNSGASYPPRKRHKA